METQTNRQNIFEKFEAGFETVWPEFEGIAIYDSWMHMTDSQKLMWLIRSNYYDPISGLCYTDNENVAAVCCSCDKIVNEEADVNDPDAISAELPPFSLLRHVFCTACAKEFDIAID